MHTICCSGRLLGGGCLSRGVSVLRGCLPWRGVCPEGGCLPRGCLPGGSLPAGGCLPSLSGEEVSGRHPAPVDRILDTRLWKHNLSVKNDVAKYHHIFIKIVVLLALIQQHMSLGINLLSGSADKSLSRYVSCKLIVDRNSSL